jgi:hypothetical protein
VPAAGSEAAAEWIQRLRPCGSCRVAAAAGRDRLKGLRLGQREREVFLGAAREAVFTVTAAGMPRAASAARRRAAQTLARAGLVAPVATGEAYGHQARAAVMLTPLGRYVADAFGRYLEAGKPIRWTRPRAGVPLPGQDPSILADKALELVRSELHATLRELKQVLVAAVARPVRDPMLLDTVTRHLQRKAQGLRDLLEPRGPKPA